jgi:hypothetical protein
MRVETVHEHETRDEFVGCERTDQFGRGLGDDGHHSLERRPVQVRQLSGELFGSFAHDRSAARTGVQQGLDSITC